MIPIQGVTRPVFADEAAPAERAPLPNIRMSTFRETEGFGETVRAAARDRRMNRVSSDIQPGGVAAAIGAYADRPTPNVVVLELGSAGSEIEKAKLEAFAEVCDAETKVIVAGRTNDVDLYRWLRERGVAEYLLVPASPSAFIDSVYRALNFSGTSGRIIAVLPAKGGCGASILCHHFAAAVARRTAIPALVADLDIAYGTAALNFDLTPLKGVAEFFFSASGGQAETIDKFVLKAESDLAVLGTSGSLLRILTLEPDTVTQGLKRMRESYSVTFLDLPHVWTDWVRAVLLEADTIVVVATPDIASLRNVKSIYETVLAARPNDSAPKLVLNMAGMRGRYELRARDFHAAAGSEPAVVIPFAPASFSEAAASGKLLFDVAPRNAETKRIEEFLAGMFSAPKPAGTGVLGNLLTRFLPQKS